MCDRELIRAILVLFTLVPAGSAFAQGIAGTGSTSTGIGQQTGPAGPGTRSGGWTQQPDAAINRTTTNTNLTPAQKNAIPPPSVRGYQK
jgi:hypothetical protein